MVEKAPLVKEMQIRRKDGKIRDGGGPTEVGGGKGSRAGEKRVGARGWKNRSRRRQFTPRPSTYGARSLRPEVPAREAEIPGTGNSGLPPEKLQEKQAHTKLDMSVRQHWFMDEMGLR